MDGPQQFSLGPRTFCLLFGSLCHFFCFFFFFGHFMLALCQLPKWVTVSAGPIDDNYAEQLVSDIRETFGKYLCIFIHRLLQEWRAILIAIYISQSITAYTHFTLNSSVRAFSVQRLAFDNCSFFLFLIVILILIRLCFHFAFRFVSAACELTYI